MAASMDLGGSAALTDFYPGYAGAFSAYNPEMGISPIQPSGSGAVMAGGSAGGVTQNEALQTVLWIGIFIVSAVFLMHWTDR